jgi:hypothetical protein
MLTSRTAARARLSGIASSNNATLSVVNSNLQIGQSNSNDKKKSSPHSQQQRNIFGLSHAIDKRFYRWAKGVLPPISKTENIALGCGTIGELEYQYIVVERVPLRIIISS